MAIKQINPIPVDSTIKRHRSPKEFHTFISSSIHELKRGHLVVVFTQEQVDIIKGYFNNELEIHFNPVENHWTLYNKKGK